MLTEKQIDVEVGLHFYQETERQTYRPTDRQSKEMESKRQEALQAGDRGGYSNRQTGGVKKMKVERGRYCKLTEVGN